MDYLDLNREDSFSFTSNIDINTDLFRTLCGEPDVGSTPLTLYSEKRVQVRRHRKKRINKKWAKKYGYRVIKVPIGDFYFSESESVINTYTWRSKINNEIL